MTSKDVALDLKLIELRGMPSNSVLMAHAMRTTVNQLRSALCRLEDRLSTIQSLFEALLSILQKHYRKYSRSLSHGWVVFGTLHSRVNSCFSS